MNLKVHIVAWTPNVKVAGDENFGKSLLRKVDRIGLLFTVEFQLHIKLKHSFNKTKLSKNKKKNRSLI